ncbi:hypothetical protein SAMN04487907_1031 [Zunongwangia mangrovi]|uniref:DUF559 domain-containing protein n=1 Tax=Zunongwangia mangrovi TaxID=1334022 RepID=A0A1I1HCN2_9FLAO|nr:hypothetical protein [Zunongwangia mangrovi]SFC21767.1 hypothetical protein SAMN04487907_1031 [Zunongwangia mangrovi]
MKKSFDNNIEKYPIVLIPDRILKNINTGIPESLVLKNFSLKRPEKPYTYPPRRPQKFKTVDYYKFNFFDLGCIVHTILGCLAMSLLSVVLGLMPFLDAFFGIFVILGLFTILTAGIFQGNPLLPRSTKHQREVEISDEEYQANMEKYEDERIIYISKKLEREKKYELDLKNYESRFKKEKNKIAHKIHLEDLRPTKSAIRIFNTNKRGANEIKFLKVLNDRLRNYTFIDKAISNNSYSPDIVLVSPTSGLHIDLEIDEPYTLHDNSPIHYKGCKDSDRNDYFLSHNWCVIRFTERQIVQNSEECCKTIISIIDSLENRIPKFDTFLDGEKSWSYEDAIILADNNYRFSYK